MANTFERYKKDIERLASLGGKLALAMQIEADPRTKTVHPFTEEELKNLPNVRSSYQGWYSEALALVSQLIPEREDDFRSYYAPKGTRKDLSYANYTMSDYLRGISATRAGDVIVGPSAANAAMYQQFNIISGLANRFASSLYDIKALLHADLLDDELHAAEELNKNGFQRGAGAMAGVVLEGHLAAVCDRHKVMLRKKDPAISDLNDALKAASVADVAQWRFIQHLGDLRNKCDHKKATDPTKEEVAELIEGVRKITKTLL
ncbi:hypothetical protein [Mesorhizobium sp. WSM4884]|uniref:hypothetical protein n=1 Tax=Mesorhizobium sp. WSM4884 TaxID=3038542 RepID=UPI002417BB1C|nr:hypothetical protein [Mesorhizobium sp. WSM4884]MDG4884941.1 hypothetical protein [Mesorhizobium sp. WSM4884]